MNSKIINKALKEKTTLEIAKENYEMEENLRLEDLRQKKEYDKHMKDLGVELI